MAMISTEEAVIRLGVALLLGAAVGIEREWRHKNAGIKTNMLVALGAAGFALLSNTFGPENHNPGQIAAAVVGGIGFIGAGVIIHRGANVQGVTTAATLWANASMGVSAGLGHLVVALIIGAGVLIVQFAMRKLVLEVARRRSASAPQRMEIRIDCTIDAMHDVNKIWNEFVSSQKILVRRRGSIKRGEDVVWHARFGAAKETDLTLLEESLVATNGVRGLEIQSMGGDDE